MGTIAGDSEFTFGPFFVPPSNRIEKMNIRRGNKRISQKMMYVKGLFMDFPYFLLTVADFFL